MIQSEKSQNLLAKFKKMNSALGAPLNEEGGQPVALKVIQGNDIVFGGRP